MYKIRKGVQSDIVSVLMLINELAMYERAANEVIVTKEQLIQDGFGINPLYGFLVATKDNIIVGLSFYFYRYSTWKGKVLYLEDLIVTEKHRKFGVGKLLFDATLQIAKVTECKKVTWQVLDWNELAILFYKKYPTHFDSSWINGSIEINK